jgi:hypothetical protein
MKAGRDCRFRPSVASLPDGIGTRLPSGDGRMRLRGMLLKRALVAAAVLAFNAPVYAGEATKPAPAAYPDTKIYCLAGCARPAPVVAGDVPNVAGHPSFTRRDHDANLVLRDVWCGDTGSCIALNHVIPPGFHDRDERDSIAIFIVR